MKLCKFKLLVFHSKARNAEAGSRGRSVEPPKLNVKTYSILSLDNNDSDIMGCGMMQKKRGLGI